MGALLADIDADADPGARSSDVMQLTPDSDPGTPSASAIAPAPAPASASPYAKTEDARRSDAEGGAGGTLLRSRCNQTPVQVLIGAEGEDFSDAVAARARAEARARRRERFRNGEFASRSGGGR